jgi:sulfur-oxidizing protein SoxA
MRHSSPGQAAAAVLALCMAAPVLAQKSTADGIAEYREMLQDGNPPSCSR